MRGYTVLSMKQNKNINKNKAKPLRVCHILFTSKMGGLEQAYIDYTRALLTYGYLVTAVILPNAPYRAELEGLGVEIVTLKIRGFYDVLAWVRLRRILRRTRPDFVLAHNGRAISAARNALLWLNIPLIGLSQSFNLKHSKKAEKLLVTTEAMRQLFLGVGYPPENCAVMYNMIEIPEHLPNLRWEKKNPPVIGFLGRLVPEKGADILLRAAHELKKRGIEVDLRIGGAGAEEEKLRGLAVELGLAAQIKFLGWLMGDAKDNFFEDIDIFCVPSTYEPFGIVVLEGWKYGVPVIAGDADGPASLIEHGVDGLLYAKNSVVALADAIEKLLTSDDGAVKNVLVAGRKKLQNFGMEVGAKRLDTLLRGFLSKTQDI